MDNWLPIIMMTMLTYASSGFGNDNLPPGAVARLGTTRFRLPGKIRQVCFSPDGKQIAAIAPGDAKFNASIAIFDSTSGRRLRSWVAHQPAGTLTASVKSIAYSPDGKMLASAGSFDGVRLWSTKTWQELRHIEMSMEEGEEECADQVVFSPDGKTLAIVVRGAYLDLWDVESNDFIRHPVSKWEGAIEAVAFSPDGRMVAVGHRQNITVFESSTGNVALSRESPKGTPYVTSLAFAKNSRFLAVGRDDAEAGISIIDISPHGASQEGRLISHESSITALAYSPDGTVLASAGWDNTVRLWDPKTGDELATLIGHRESISSVDFSPDGQWLVSGDHGGVIQVWDLQKRASRDAAEPNAGTVESVAFSPDGSTIASGGQDGLLRLWNLETWESKIVAEHPDYEIEQVAFFSDGRFVAVADGRHRRPSKLPHSITAYDASSGKIEFALHCGSEPINCMAFSADGRYVASASSDKFVRLWDLATRKPIWEFEPPISYRPKSVAFSPHADLLAIGSHNQVIQLWDTSTRRHLHDFAEHWEEVHTIEFSPDSKRLVSGGRDHTARVWDVAKRSQIFCLGEPKPKGNPYGLERAVDPAVLCPGGHADSVSCLACSPDGQFIATGSLDTTVRLWSMNSGNHLATLEGHEAAIRSVAFSPDSRLLVSASSDTTMLVWDVQIALKRNQ